MEWKICREGIINASDCGSRFPDLSRILCLLVCFVVAAFLLLGVKTLFVVLYVAIPFAMEFHLVYYKVCGQGHQDIGISSFNGKLLMKQLDCITVFVFSVIVWL